MPFLILQIPDRRRSRMHVCPFENATRGELAVYCLQYVLATNWYDLTPDYRCSFFSDHADITDQQLLRGLISTRTRAQDMMAAWEAAYANTMPN